MESISARRIMVTIAAVLSVFALGTIGFHDLLHEPWHSAFYRTVVTATLTGLDSTPRGIGAELLTIGLVLSGVTIFGYVAAQVVDSIAHGILGGAWKEKRRRTMIDRLSDHIVICGYGRVGRRIADELRTGEIPYVVLDFSDDAVAAAAERDDLFIQGTGTEDEDLEKAGIDRARGLIVASDSDADNLYITLSARSRRPELSIVARATDEDAEKKLRLAGADRVVLPYATAGRVMANLMVRPQVAAFVNVLTSVGADLSFEEIEVRAECGQGGKTIRELDIFERTGAYVVAVRKEDGSFDTRPSKDTVLETGDVIVGVGAADEIRALENLFEPRERVGR